MENVRVTKVSPSHNADKYFIKFRKNLKPGARGANVSGQVEVLEIDLEEGSPQEILDGLKRQIDGM